MIRSTNMTELKAWNGNWLVESVGLLWDDSNHTLKYVDVTCPICGGKKVRGHGALYPSSKIENSPLEEFFLHEDNTACRRP